MTRYFQEELNYLRDTGRDFARVNPKLTKYLGEVSTDPDVERLLEGFAFLTGKIREKIDDELPELTQSIIQLLWPHFLRPFPPTTMIKFSPTNRAITHKQVIDTNTPLLSKPVEERVIQFKTVAPCTIYPLELADSMLERTRDRCKIILSFATLSGLPASGIGVDDLRLWFSGDTASAQMLYLWTLRYLRSVKLVSKINGLEISYPKDKIVAGGFSPQESVLPQVSSAFDGYRLLQEYFVVPEKFHCVDFKALGGAIAQIHESEFTIELEYERPLPADVKLRQDNMRLYCTPALNLYEADAEPFAVNHFKTSYSVLPRGGDHQYQEIFAIRNVLSQYAATDGTRRNTEISYPPFESFIHEVEQGDQRRQVYFRQKARQAYGARGFDYEISFVLHDSEHQLPSEETLSINLECFNRDLAMELAIGDVCIATQGTPAFATFQNITRPTAPVHPPLDGALNWNLISNLSLNYMSLLDRRALGTILASYDHKTLSDRQAERAANQRLAGILSLKTKPMDRLFRGLPIRGLHTRIEMRESCFQTEGEMFLFASVLAEFFSLYATTNSFHELEVHGEDYGEVYKWPAKIGRQPLI